MDWKKVSVLIIIIIIIIITIVIVVNIINLFVTKTMMMLLSLKGHLFMVSNKGFCD